MRPHALFGAAVAIFAGVAYFAFAQHATTARGHRPRLDSARPQSVESSAQSGPQQHDDGATVAAIQQALLTQVLGTHQAQPAPAPVDALTQARETLDQRLATAVANPQETARLEQALRNVIDAQALGNTTASVKCGGSLCKVDLSDSDDASVAQGTLALAEHVPKVFAATAVYPQGAGRRAMYLATRAEDLELVPAAGKFGGVDKNEATLPRAN